MIKNIVLADLEDVVSLEKSCFISPYGLNTLKSSFSSSSFFGVIEKNKEVEGYLLSTVVLDEANIDRVAVKNEYRNRGVASKLISYTEGELMKKGVKTVYLEVRISNERAIRLYTKLGYESVAVRKKYYDGVEDAFVMKKILVE